MLDHDGYQPAYALLTEGRVADITIAQHPDMPKGSMVVMDRSYNAYHMFGCWSVQQSVGFVTRLDANADCFIIEEHPVPQHRYIRADETTRVQLPSRQAGTSKAVAAA